MGIGNELIGDIEQLLTNNVITSKGLFRFSKNYLNNYCSIFEDELSKFYHNLSSLLLPSASIGLLTILKALELSDGDEILIPSFSWKANYAAINLSGCLIRFIDIDENLEINIETIKKNLSPKARAVLIPHLMGRAQKNIIEISSFCRNNNLFLIEDISQSFGVKIGMRMAGSFGDASYSSLNHHKILSTGDGGFVLIKDKTVFNRVMTLHDQGCHIAQGKRVIPANSGFGSSLRVSNLVGAVAVAQLSKFFLIKTKIWNCYNQIRSIMSEYLELEELMPNEGDIPFFYLFKNHSQSIVKLPSLRESGWHSVENIETFPTAQRSKLLKNYIHLSNVYSIGTGLIDEYYATPIGLNICFNNKDVELLKNNIKESIL